MNHTVEDARIVATVWLCNAGISRFHRTAALQSLAFQGLLANLCDEASFGFVALPLSYGYFRVLEPHIHLFLCQPPNCRP